MILNGLYIIITKPSLLHSAFFVDFLDHENCIQLIDIPKPDKRTGYDDIYIITDLMETDLHRVIYSRQDLSDDHIQYFIYQVLRGMKFIHSAKIMHRDLKPSNILLNKNCDLKICDFGLARGFESDTEFKTEYVVTRWYRAPEVILNASEYTKAIDVWSVGCILAELLGRTSLFPGENYLDQVQRIIAVLGTPNNKDLSYIGNESALKYIKSLPKRSKQSLSTLYFKANFFGLDLLGKMLIFNPDERYTIEDCLAHPYFDGLHNEEEEPTSEEAFDWSFDNFEPTRELLQSMVYDEACKFQKAHSK
jgi:mitogen-activated protein kinase 1/3